MTALDRIFLRRHYAVFLQLSDKTTARRATIRQGCAFGMKGTEVARFFRMSKTAVYDALGRQGAAHRLTAAVRATKRAENALAIAQGRERSARERVNRLLPGGNQ